MPGFKSPMAGTVGFEPTMPEPKSDALPLGYVPTIILNNYSTHIISCQMKRRKKKYDFNFKML